MSSKNAKKEKNVNSTLCAKQSVLKNVSKENSKSVENFFQKAYNTM